MANMLSEFSIGATDDSRYIREKVFIEEQGFKEEFDIIDDFADTLVLYDDNKPVATGRVYELDTPHSFKLGRIAVMKEYRKSGLGRQIIELMEKHAIDKGANVLYISAQVVARPFYEKCGYTANGDTYLEEHVMHIRMKKIL